MSEHAKQNAEPLKTTHTDVARLARIGSILISVCVFGLYGLRAAALLTYPFDWAPDEGLFLDYARRVIVAPETLYPANAREAIPTPLFWTPLFPIVLAPVVALTDDPVLVARLIVIGFVLTMFVALIVLVRSRDVTIGIVACALVIAPMTTFFLLIRMDVLMFALWLCASVILMPGRIERGHALLSWSSAVGGGTLLLLAVLAKQTAVILGLPLVLAWLLVDVRSFVRLSVVTGGAGLLLLGLLELATDGGFSASTIFYWSDHPSIPEQVPRILSAFLFGYGPLLAWTCVGVVVSLVRSRPGIDGAWTLVCGGLLFAPMLFKFGATFHYCLPFALGAAVLGARAWLPHRRIGAGVGASLALFGAAAEPLVVPTAEDTVTADAFYDFVDDVAGPAPLLAVRPDLASFRSGVAVEVEGTTLAYLGATSKDHAVLRVVTERLDSRHYALVVANPKWLPASEPFGRALVGNYELIAACELRHSYGPTTYVIFAPRSSGIAMPEKEGTRCVVGAAAKILFASPSTSAPERPPELHREP